GITFADKRYVLWLVPVSALSIILSWGDNFAAFNYFLFDYLPAYNMFRSVTFTLIIIIFCMPLLGMLGLQNLLKRKADTATLKKLAWPAGILLGLCFVLGVSGGFGSFLRVAEEQLPAWFTSALRADRIDLFRSDAWRSFWFIAVFGGVIFARLKTWIGDPLFFAIAIVLISLDLSFVDRRYLSGEQYQRKRQASITPTAADQEILKDGSYYRVYNIQSPLTEARTSYFHHSIGGYHGAKLRRYQDLFDSCLYQQTQALYEDLQAGQIMPEHYGVMNMLNVKYFTYGPDQVFANPSPNGSAWFVKELVTANSPTEELALVCDINTRDQAVVDVSKFDAPASLGY